MVYRGKPSAGCENCRKAKKRCTLELPACTRCVKLKKDCVGYRDTTQLQIQDETQSVLQKVEKRKATVPIQHAQVASRPAVKKINTQKPAAHTPPTPIWQFTNFNSLPGATPLTPDSVRSASSQDHLAQKPDIFQTGHSVVYDGRPLVGAAEDSLDHQLRVLPELNSLQAHAYSASAYAVNLNLSSVFTLITWASGIPKSPQPLPDDIAINMFLNCCTADGQWSYFHETGFMEGRNSCLDLAIKACGMAALNNVRPIPQGREWSRSMYTKAIVLLNDALKDQHRCRQDDSLVAVTMLSFYENLTCDSMQSIQSWKAHIQGATQLLKLRGKAQFNTMAGRQLFRELRAQILISCIWDDLKPPDFLKDWQESLATCSTTLAFIGPADQLIDISFEVAGLRHAIKSKTITDAEALNIATKVDAKLLQWSVEAPASEDRWKYGEMQVNDSPHVWNGMVHNYPCLPGPSVWNMYRAIRILVSRTHELLARSVAKSEEEKNAQIQYSRTVRRQMTDDICAAVPCLLGTASPAFCSPCVLTTSYASIWPIFFAATCALERLGMNMWEPKSSLGGDISERSGAIATAFSTAATQAAWLLGRLDHISSVLGVKWADAIARSLREAIKVHKEKAMAYRATLEPGSEAESEYLSIAGEIVRGVMGFREQQYKHHKQQFGRTVKFTPTDLF